MSDDILTKIVARKREEVAVRRQRFTVSDLKDQIKRQHRPRGFVDSIKKRIGRRQAAIIAEIKKASPSKGVIREDFDPVSIAESYEQSGAACLSVLTDVDFFQGSDEYLQLAKAHSSLPVLRKDFTVSPYQIYESRAIGADCILLIAAILDAETLHTYYDLAQSLGLDVLIEVHNKEELECALTLSPKLLGINNRNLKTFEVSLNTTLDLLADIPKGVTVVTESGIRQRADVAQMISCDVYGFLVGEAFMKEPDPGQALAFLFS
ncbi:MAG: indole-3-glycerol phosphate synthase TrpC [Pseudomonadales bacterium]|nr:indole-3-glycerol phosphate synthase TrpC [Pseudomonadales bacterium]MBO6703945.1 indole-3-glycerol phosphate synthase TrpC [Pseudomonadales bacterium]MBO7006158.1 indole-3-glycerol phosphate synthase TrpC [Pseudomonadales bacterium]